MGKHLSRCRDQDGRGQLLSKQGLMPAIPSMLVYTETGPEYLGSFACNPSGPNYPNVEYPDVEYVWL